MGWFDNEDEIPVEIDCRCDNTPHEKDTVWLYPHLTVEGGLAGETFYENLRSGGVPTVGVLIGQLGALLLQHGISRWSFVDKDGNPVPCNPRNIARFTHNWDAAKPVAEKANELYGEQMTAPLVDRLSKSSRRGQTGASTSRKRSGSGTRRKRSRPSTTATTPPALKVIPSSDGDSSTSPRKRSATA